MWRRAVDSCRVWMRGASEGCRSVRRSGLLADMLGNWTGTRDEGVLVMARSGECDVWERILRTFGGDCRGFAGVIVRWEHTTSITSHDTRQVEDHVQLQLVSKGYIHLLSYVEQLNQKNPELNNKRIASVPWLRNYATSAEDIWNLQHCNPYSFLSSAPT